jgi:predicted RNase H-like nuclease (RuvC/YqgF family)
VEDQTDEKDSDDALAECEETVEHLKEENAQLRESAQTFGDLAERLNTQRRLGNNQLPRESPRPGGPRSPPGKG